jgi:hypothetical protein
LASLLLIASSLLTPVVRGPPSLSPLDERVGQPHHQECYLPPPIIEWWGRQPLLLSGRGCRTVTRVSTAPIPPPPASPSLWVEGRYRQAGPKLACPSPPPLHRSRRQANQGSETQQQLSTLPAEPQLSCAASSWASIVQEGTCSSCPPQLPSTMTSDNISKDDFVGLYERCLHAGQKTCVAIRYVAR